MLKSQNRAFTLIELLVVISIVAVLMAIMLPALQKSREVTLNMRCTSNLRAIGVADETYRNDWNRWFVIHNRFVPLLAEYTGTLPQYYEWQGYGTNYIKYAKALPFKCPVMVKDSKWDGGYGQGIGTITGGGISDYSLNTALHQSPSSNEYITRRRDTQLVHTPSEVLNFADGRNNVRLDYSSFGAQFRHFEGDSINLLYVDGHASPVKNPGITLNRGGNNSIWNPLRPYWWW
jgi:prepilin-type N-terminal cleavage/methylation domain-containing protein/prepilin-type processing-associated H-X9-DG protein